MSNSLLKNALLRSTMLVGVAALATPAFAQATAAADAAAAAEEEIVVTGTLIANPNIESSSPVTVVGEDELVLRNVSNVENLLRQLPGVVAGVGAQTNNGNGGFASIDLRGLGSKRNLVLLDGQRIVPAQQNGTVDLNNIPVAIIARTEVLTGGASTTYGADAVSGVVNFITKKDFEGIDLSSSYQITERGDGPIFRTDLTLGGNFADGRGNAVLSVGYQKAKPVYQGDRDISVFGINSASTGAAAGTASGSSPTSVPVTLGFSNLGLIGVTGTTAQVNAAGTLLVAPYQGFNFNPFNIFQTPYERHNMYGAANYEVSDNLEVYARAIFSRNAVKTIIAPSGIFGEALTIPGNNPYLPATLRDQLCTLNGIALGAACNTATAIRLPVVYRRTVEIGPRISDYRTTMFDTRVGATYAITDSIKANIEASHGESDLVQKQSGYVLRSRVQQALNANNVNTCTVTTNGCVPLNLFGNAGSISPAQAAFLNGSSTITIKNKLDQVRGLVSGDFGTTLPAAADPISFAVGAEYRKYGYLRDPDAFSISPGELGGAGGAVLPFAGGYSVKEGYAELVAPLAADKPLMQDLSVEAGIRYSAYDVDTRTAPQNKATTWKVGLNWEASDAVKFRGNFQRAVRAPNIDELFRPVATGLTNLAIDACAGSAPVGNAALTAACIGQGAPAASIGSIPNPAAGQANATFGGNVNLDTETADTYTVGLVLQPGGVASGLTITVDYYNIKVKDAIATATPGDVNAACFGTNPAAITLAQAASVACTSIRRSGTTGALSGSAASGVLGLPTPFTNLGLLKTDGVDLTVDYKRDLGFAELNWNFQGNWTRSSSFRASPTAFTRECVGYFSANCGVQSGNLQPELSWNQRTTLTFGSVDVSVLWRYIDGMQYEGQAADFAARNFTATSRNLFNGVVRNVGPAASPLAGNTYNFNKIKAYSYFDLTVRWQVGEHFDLAAGVQNVFDRDPPLVGAQAGSTGANSGNTFPNTYDPLGRSYSISGRIRF